MSATRHFVLLCLGLQLALSKVTPPCGEALEKDEECLMQGSAAVNLMQTRQNRLEEEVLARLPLCFTANLKANTVAMQANAQSKVSYGTASIEISEDAAKVDIDWVVPLVTADKPVIGVAIHEGDASSNGPILIGFCGGAPLPSFSGSCKQDIMVNKYHIEGQACNVVGEGTPCASGGSLTLQQAVAKISSRANFWNPYGINHNFYLNVHTKFDENSVSLGVMRGQLWPKPCLR